jgi:hypothetical protein
MTDIIGLSLLAFFFIASFGIPVVVLIVAMYYRRQIAAWLDKFGKK